MTQPGDRERALRSSLSWQGLSNIVFDGEPPQPSGPEAQHIQEQAKGAVTRFIAAIAAGDPTSCLAETMGSYFSFRANWGREQSLEPSSWSDFESLSGLHFHEAFEWLYAGRAYRSRLRFIDVVTGPTGAIVHTLETGGLAARVGPDPELGALFSPERPIPGISWTNAYSIWMVGRERDGWHVAGQIKTISNYAPGISAETLALSPAVARVD